MIGSEQLTSELIGGRWHAVYPTAGRTLCGLQMPDARKHGRRYPPDCGVCSLAARRFERIDAETIPGYWKVAA